MIKHLITFYITFFLSLLLLLFSLFNCTNICILLNIFIYSFIFFIYIFFFYAFIYLYIYIIFIYSFICFFLFLLNEGRGSCGAFTVSVTWLCSSLGLELMVKLRTLLTVFTIILKAKARDYGKGTFSDAHLWCSANYNALCQLANQSRLCLSEGGACRKRSVWERRGIEDLQ